MDQITICTRELVRDDLGEIILLGNNKVLIRHLESGVVFDLPLTSALAEIFGYSVQEEVLRNLQYNHPDDHAENCQQASTSGTSSSVRWPRDCTLMLIYLCKDFENDFKSTTIKNMTVYTRTAEELNEDMGTTYTGTQCKDKVKYLKMRYMKWNDNRTTSGAAAAHFEFAKEVDEVFGNKPNVKPVAIASSSSSSFAVLDSDSEEQTTDDEPSPKKRKKEGKEAAAERRHHERLQMQQKAIEMFEKQ